MHTPGFHGAEQTPSLAADLKLRDAFGIVDDLDVGPCYLSSPAGFQGLQEGLLCRETAGVRLGRRRTLAFTILAFATRKHAFSKTRCSGDRFADSVNFHYVGAD